MTISNHFRHTANKVVLSAGTTIFCEGDRQAMMYVVLEGAVDMFVRDRRIATIGVGGIVGELSMLMQQPRSATAIARTDCTLARIDEQQFTYLVQQTSCFANQLIDMLQEQ
jgi:CRP/FNR family transcriptional regulator, cyclic AMP receptor protein